jgi:ketosteroid isomerase-like protein
MLNLRKENDTLDRIDEVEARNHQLVQAGFDNWKNGRGSIYDLLAPEAKWTIVGNSPAARTYESRQDFIENVIQPFNARLSSRLVPTVQGIYTDGDMVIVLWDGIATARDGKPYRNSYAWFLQMQEGQIVKATAFFDSIEFTDFWTRFKPDES